MSNPLSIERVSSRKLLGAMLPTASDLEAFCLDHFPDVAARFASGQNRIDRDNLLLQLADTQPLHEALALYHPRRFARYGRLFLAAHSAASRRVTNPYRGLSTFQVGESDLFFGRDELTERLWVRFKALYEQTGSTRLLAVLGPSGSGKSSVARAGLLAELQSSPIPGPAPGDSVLLQPGERPLAALAIALLPARQQPATAMELSEQRSFADFMRQPNGRGEFDGLSQWAANRPSGERLPLVVLVDQFEEVYTLCSNPQEREAFVGVLLHAAAARSRHVSIVLTLRSDFLGDTHRHHPELNRIIGAQAIIVTAMDRDELRQAIAAPAAHTGQPLDDATIELLINQAWGNEGSLPLLEFALTSIWEELQAGKEPGATLRELGGVGGALAGKAQEIFDKLDERAQATAQRALVRLVRLGEGTRDTRRRVPISELCGRGETDTHVLDVLRKFATEQARLVTLSSDGNEPLAEVTHEALFDHWAALRTWIEQGRKDRGLYDRALAAARLWQVAGRPRGRLWRPPDLDLLADYQRRKPEDIGSLAAEFLGAAQSQKRTEGALRLGTVAAVVLALLTAAGVYVVKERQRAQAAAAAEEYIRRQLLSSYVERGRRLLFEHGNPSEGLLWLHRAQVGGSTDPALPDLLDSALYAAETSKTVLAGHQSGVYGAAYSPDGRHIVTASVDKTARVWEADSGRLVAELKGHTAAVYRATYSPDGRRIVTVSEDHTARVWEADSGQLVAELKGHGDRVYRATHSPDSRRIVTVSDDKTARVWDADSGRLVVTLNGHTHRVYGAMYSPDGRRIVTASWDRTARIWEADSGRLVAELKGHADRVWSATYSPDGRRIITASVDKTARIWEADSGRLLTELTGHGDSVYRAAYSPDGRRIVTASNDHTAHLWDANSGRLLTVLKGHRARVWSAMYSPDGRRIVTASDDKTARVWKVESGRLLSEVTGHENPVHRATYSPDGQRIVTASGDTTARVWDSYSGRLIAELRGHAASVQSAIYTPDGRRIVTASADHTARVWDSYSGRLIAELRGHAASVHGATFSPDGRRIVTASGDKTARVWEADSGRQVVELIGHGQCVYGATFSPDGRHIVTASADGTARVWEAERWQLVTELKGHKGTVWRAMYSPDGHRIVTASEDGMPRIWDAEGGRLVSVLKGHEGSVYGAMYSPNGHRIVTASADHTARVWEVDSGRQVAELKGHGARVYSAAYTPDGRRIVTASEDRTVRVWAAAPEPHRLQQLDTFVSCHLAVQFDPRNQDFTILRPLPPENCPESAALR